MKAVSRMLDDMDQLATHALQELRLVLDDSKNPKEIAAYFAAMGALSAVSGAIAGAKLSIKMFQ